VAATHAAHTTRISGVIVSINATRHTLKLRVTHGTKHHKAVTARAASAGDSRGILVAFGDATVHGPNGAVAVGEDVTVTTTGPVGQSTVASSIDVIGQPNGGTAGKGAAVPGEVTAVDPTNGTLTLTVRATDSQGQSQDSSVIVDVSATTILAVGDTNGDGQITLADVAVGDHVVVFTLDASANPLAAIGILDASHAGGNHQGGGEGDHRAFTAIPGTVTSVDVAGPSLMVTVGDGALAGTKVTVDLGEHTSFGGQDSGSNGPMNLSDISVGDTVTVYTRDATTTPIVAVGIVDNSRAHADTVRRSRDRRARRRPHGERDQRRPAERAAGGRQRSADGVTRRRHGRRGRAREPDQHLSRRRRRDLHARYERLTGGGRWRA
jgi:hypothetical protein